MAGDTEPVPDQKPLVHAAKLGLANPERSGARRFLHLLVADVGPYEMFLDDHQILRIDELCTAPLMAVVAQMQHHRRIALAIDLEDSRGRGIVMRTPIRDRNSIGGPAARPCRGGKRESRVLSARIVT